MTAASAGVRPYTRTRVVDLAYGQSTVDGRAGPDLTWLLNAIDVDRIVVDGRPIPSEMLWERVFDDLIGGDDVDVSARLLVGVPSTWGLVRRGVLDRATARVRADIDFVARAILIARSHADVTVARCVVVETTHVPSSASGPARTGPAQTGSARTGQQTWDVTRLRRCSDDWEIEACGVLTPSGDDELDAPAVEALVDDGVAAVYVDGVRSDDDSAPDAVDEAIAVVSRHAVAGRVLAVDHRLIARWGVPRPLPAMGDDVPPPEPTRRRGRAVILVGALVMTALVATLAIVVGARQQHQQPPAGEVLARVGRTTLLVPAGWARSEPPAPGGGGSGSQSRTVFSDADDGARILMVQSPVRVGASQSSVAVSLHNRIRQRGDEVVSEFSPSTRFAGRDVISYRESPESGAAIRWYVLVAHDLQVSIGCQAGTGAESIDGPCAVAVSSARIGAR